VIYKIADDLQSIANAARRFLDQEEQMDVKVHNVFAGHLRSIVGTMTIEDMIRNRDALTKATRESSATEMQRLGLTIDSLQIQEIEDSHGYIDNLAAPESARVAKDARIAQAAADREATEREQEADALKVAATAHSQIKQAQAKAEAQQAESRAEQAGPLAAATAKQEVVVQETRVAELEAERTEQQLQVEVRKPADAEAYKTRTVAEAPSLPRSPETFVSSFLLSLRARLESLWDVGLGAEWSRRRRWSEASRRRAEWSGWRRAGGGAGPGAC
jgi:flotillin